MVERLLGADAAASVRDERLAEEVTRLGAHGVPGGRTEAVGALERVHQRLCVRAAEERRLAAQPAQQTIDTFSNCNVERNVERKMLYPRRQSKYTFAFDIDVEDTGFACQRKRKRKVSRCVLRPRKKC